MQISASKVLSSVCVAAACLVGAFFAPAASAQTDQLIVRNERIGAVRLGDTLAVVVATLGEPTIAHYYRREAQLYFGDPQAWTVSTWGPQNEVYMISVFDPSFATPEGVTRGMSETDVRIRLGNPEQRVWSEVFQIHQLAYPGLLVTLSPTNRVVSLSICQQGMQRRLGPRRNWCDIPN